jgi:hypothetical protein
MKIPANKTFLLRQCCLSRHAGTAAGTPRRLRERSQQAGDFYSHATNPPKVKSFEVV